tara:strand:+ start:7089 stop:7502 length:414 start_codon:yes stop_codon:yes gene_type:complete
MEYLPCEVKLKIIGYLPIITNDIKQLNLSIKRIYYFRYLCKFYKKICESYTINEYDEWLLNDMIHWMNRDIGTTELITKKCKRIILGAFKTTHCENYLDIMSLESYYMNLDLCRMYFEQLDDDEIQDLIHFCRKMYF